MRWSDHGIVVSATRHSERNAVVAFLTANHGRHMGLARMSSKNAAFLQPGTKAQVSWQARLNEHLGTWTIEPTAITCASVLTSPEALSALSSACAWVSLTLPEREPHPRLHQRMEDLLQSLSTPNWWPEYVQFEINLLKELGFGLDLTQCAASGETEDLIYVSPRTGRAVSLQAGQPYHSRLLPLPAFLVHSQPNIDREAICQGLRLTAYFLERYLLSQHNTAMPAARNRLYSYANHGKQTEL